jgi:hypothetical protein
MYQIALIVANSPERFSPFFAIQPIRAKRNFFYQIFEAIVDHLSSQKRNIRFYGNRQLATRFVPCFATLKPVFIPLITRPKTTCFPLQRGASFTVMKNCLPLPLALALAIATRPGPPKLTSKLSSSNTPPQMNSLKDPVPFA